MCLPILTIVIVAIACLALSVAVLAEPAGVATAKVGHGELAAMSAVAPSTTKNSEGFLGQVIVFLQPGTDPVAFGKANGLTYLSSLRSDPNAHVFQAGSQSATTLAMTSLSSSPQVRAVYENRRSQNVLNAFTPNDPYWRRAHPTGWSGPGQWHLWNEYVTGRDVNILPAWNKDMTGYGVIIGMVDDCLETAHPDLAANYIAEDSWDFGQDDADPNPVNSDDQHGVSTSGVAAARGGNGIGVIGAAPYASLAGLRIDFPTQTDAMFVDATLYHSSDTNTDIGVKNHSYSISDPCVDNVAQDNAILTSAGYGTVHVFSAGNERGSKGQDANKKMCQNNPCAIAVAALGSDGKFASYSNFGANVFCTAPSSSRSGLYKITTTDRTGALGYNSGSGDTFPDNNYTSMFGGTSSSAPLVAGVLAVVKEVRPNLDWIFAKQLLAHTCTVVDPTDSTYESDGGWTTNAAGLKFNQNYGFGLVNAEKLCDEARKYSGVTWGTYVYVDETPVMLTIPDGDALGGVDYRIMCPATTEPVDWVQVTLKVNADRRGDLIAYLESPSGTVSRLMVDSVTDTASGVTTWTYRTNAFWGEPMEGDWWIKVTDVNTPYGSIWESMAFRAYTSQLITDVDGPKVTIDQSTTQADPTTVSPIIFDVVFDEWVEDFTSADVRLSGTAGATTSTVTGSGRRYKVTVSGMRDTGTVIATIPAGAAHDKNGNPSIASTSIDNTVTFTSPPVNSSITPSGGSIASGSVTLSSVYYDTNGYADIKKTYLLINDSLTQANAVLLYYDRSGNKIYLKNDANTSWGTGYAPGASATLTNSQCKVYLSSTTASGSGNNLTVKWQLELKAPFSAKSLSAYMYCQNIAGLTDGWDRLGIYYNEKPQVISVDPTGVLPVGSYFTFKSTYRDLNGFADLRKCYLLINDSLTQTNAVFLWYDKAGNKVYLKNDANTSWGTGYTPGTSVTISNSQCQVALGSTTTTTSGSDLTVNWRIMLKPSMTGKNLYSWLYVTDSTGAFEGWKKIGTHFAPLPPECTYLSPTTGTVDTGFEQTFSTIYSDPNGYADINLTYLQLSVTSSQANAVFLMYDAKQNKIFLRNDANTSWGTGGAPGSATILENSQCKVNLASMGAPSGVTTEQLEILWPIELKPSQAGKLLCERMFVRDNALLNSGWKVKGYVRGH